MFQNVGEKTQNKIDKEQKDEQELESTEETPKTRNLFQKLKLSYHSNPL